MKRKQYMSKLFSPAVLLLFFLSVCPITFAGDLSADINCDNIVDFKDCAIIGSQWLSSGTYDTPDITWININDPGIGSGYEHFLGQMSKYETTNAQYCRFLNDALDSGDIYVSAGYVYGANGSNKGTDFADWAYYNLNGAGNSYNGAVNGGAARINYAAGSFTVDSGFENYPVNYVSWYGATAFCNYYGWRLPTEWQWQAVADFDGSYSYGCGKTINNDSANYLNSTHPDGTAAVGDFGTYGYGAADMAGNVFEWTSSLHIPGDSSNINRILRGGAWYYGSSLCVVSNRSFDSPNRMHSFYGFRVCRDNFELTIVVPDVVGMTLQNAQAAVIDAELKLGAVSDQYSSDIESGHVISQNPSAGESVSYGATVALVISLGPEPTEPDITWVAINDQGIVGKNEGFTGEMAKYETTNEQYCWFLNDAIETGDIYVQDGYVYGANGSDEGADFAEQPYYYISGPGGNSEGVINGGAARINYTNGSFEVDCGFENHPVTYVSWYGAAAFANYYGWRLPTEWQWQAVADYDGTFIYGCGTTIEGNANYSKSEHCDGTTVVGAFGTYGYEMADMAGNVWEWTSSTYLGSFRVMRGGC